MTSSLPLLLKVKEVKDLLNIGINQTYELIARGELPSIRRTPKCIRVPRAAIDEWISKNQSASR
jgi:excisionase family DNA binding protein